MLPCSHDHTVLAYLTTVLIHACPEFDGEPDDMGSMVMQISKEHKSSSQSSNTCLSQSAAWYRSPYITMLIEVKEIRSVTLIVKVGDALEAIKEACDGISICIRSKVFRLKACKVHVFLYQVAQYLSRLISSFKLRYCCFPIQIDNPRF